MVLAKKDSMLTTMQVLKDFKLATGLEIDWDKNMAF